MRGRARLISRSGSLRGEKVNGYQWNPSAGVGRSEEDPTALKKKRKDKKKQERAQRKLKVTAIRLSTLKAINALSCPECRGRFESKAAVIHHLIAAHGVNRLSAAQLSICPECGVLMQSSRINTHRRKVHSVV